MTAPRERPWTSLSWAANPAMSTGRDTTKEAAHTLRQEQTLAGHEAGEEDRCGLRARVPVRTRAKSSSFQEKMKQISEVAAIPGMTTGATICAQGPDQPAPSTEAASRISTGTSARNERIIHTAIGRFIEV